MYSKLLMPQSCSLGGAKAVAGQSALGKQVTAAGAEGQVPAPVAPQTLWPEGSHALSKQWTLQGASLLLQAGAARGPALAVPVPLHGAWLEAAGFPTMLACAWLHGCRHATRVLKLKGFVVSRIMITLGKEMSLLDEEKKLGCNTPCWTVWEML